MRGDVQHVDGRGEGCHRVGGRRTGVQLGVASRRAAAIVTSSSPRATRGPTAKPAVAGRSGAQPIAAAPSWTLTRRRDTARPCSPASIDHGMPCEHAGGRDQDASGLCAAVPDRLVHEQPRKRRQPVVERTRARLRPSARYGRMPPCRGPRAARAALLGLGRPVQAGGTARPLRSDGESPSSLTVEHEGESDLTVVRAPGAGLRGAMRSFSVRPAVPDHWRSRARSRSNDARGLDNQSGPPVARGGRATRRGPRRAPGRAVAAAARSAGSGAGALRPLEDRRWSPDRIADARPVMTSPVPASSARPERSRLPTARRVVVSRSRPPAACREPRARRPAAACTARSSCASSPSSSGARRGVADAWIVCGSAPRASGRASRSCGAAAASRWSPCALKSLGDIRPPSWCGAAPAASPPAPRLGRPDRWRAEHGA